MGKRGGCQVTLSLGCPLRLYNAGSPAASRCSPSVMSAKLMDTSSGSAGSRVTNLAKHLMWEVIKRLRPAFGACTPHNEQRKGAWSARWLMCAGRLPWVMYQSALSWRSSVGGSSTSAKTLCLLI
eukprot:6479060-Amphidinium_carterae.2